MLAKTENELLWEAIEYAWVILANVSEGEWWKQTEEWQEAVEKWRDRYYHPVLENRKELSTPVRRCIK